MITNFFIPPHPLLEPFIDNYILSTSLGKKITLRGSWPASNETSLIFYLADKPSHHTSEGVVSSLKNDTGCIVGLLSHSNGFVSFSGVYHTFIIQFKANGFNKLFRLPVAELINRIFHIDDVLGNRAGKLNEALQIAKDIQEMACSADKLLLQFLRAKEPYINLQDGITFISSNLSKSTPLLSIEQYAYNANMSVRNFGRRFIEQVGVSPKFYCRLLRFNNAINEKLRQPQASWTTIAYECGYYDQMHMIKDFKEFADINPSSIFESNTETTRPHKDLSGCNDASTQPDTMVNREKFILVERRDF